jgi:hypothetical protein
MHGLHSTSPSTCLAMLWARFSSVTGSSSLLANSTATSSCLARACTPLSTPVKNGLSRSDTMMPMCPVRLAGLRGPPDGW